MNDSKLSALKHLKTTLNVLDSDISGALKFEDETLEPKLLALKDYCRESLTHIQMKITHMEDELEHFSSDVRFLSRL